MRGMSNTFRSCWLVVGVALGMCSASRAEYVYTAGHGDIGVAYEDGGLHLHYHLGPNAVIDGSILGTDLEAEPSEVTTIVTGPTFDRPGDSSWSFIGNSAGAPVWFLPQVNDPSKPFLGLATEELDPAEWVGGMTWELLDVTHTSFGNPGTGQFSLWQTSFLGTPTALWSEAAGVSSFTTAIGGHDHYNFGFTAEGIYDVAIRVSLESAQDGRISTTGVFRFNVGPQQSAVVPEPSSFALLGIGAGTLMMTRIRRRSRNARTDSSRD